MDTTKLQKLIDNRVNVSLYECRSPREIFVATYERGAGLTLSCGTAMTASATAVTCWTASRETFWNSSGRK